MSTSSEQLDEFLKLVVPLHSEISTLKEENEKLKLKIEDGKKLDNNLEKENEQLKEEINNLRRVVSDMAIKKNEAGDVSLLEEKCRNLEAENKKLNMEITTEIASKNLKEIELKKLRDKLKLINDNKPVSELMEQLENYKQINIQAATKIAKLGKQLEKNKRNYEEDLKNYIFEYDKCREDLRQKGITVQEQNFPRLLDEFRRLCHGHEMKGRHTFKIAYEIDQNVKKKSEELQKLMLQNSHEVRQLIVQEQRKLTELKRINFYDDLNAEKRNFENLKKIASEETIFLKSLLLASASTPSTSQDTKPNTSKDKNTNYTKTFNNNLNYKQTNKAWKSKSFNNLVNKDLYKPEQKESYSVIMHHFPESGSDKNDLLEVKFFLMKQLYIKDADDISISRMGLPSGGLYPRPVVVTLSNRRIFDDILKHTNRKISYRGAAVQIYKHDKLDLY